jgi:hypothetical protein
MVHVWYSRRDIRAKKALYTIAGHKKLVSNVKFQPTRGDYLVTSSYDNTCKIWSAHNFKLIKTLAGHASRVMRMDISSDSKMIASAAYDETYKLWTADDDYVSDDEEAPYFAPVITQESEAERLAKIAERKRRWGMLDTSEGPVTAENTGEKVFDDGPAPEVVHSTSNSGAVEPQVKTEPMDDAE